MAERPGSDESKLYELAFKKGLADLLNAHSREGGSNTPDYRLAEFLFEVLLALDDCIRGRDAWYGLKPGPGRSGSAAVVEGADRHNREVAEEVRRHVEALGTPEEIYERAEQLVPLGYSIRRIDLVPVGSGWSVSVETFAGDSRLLVHFTDDPLDPELPRGKARTAAQWRAKTEWPEVWVNETYDEWRQQPPNPVGGWRQIKMAPGELVMGEATIRTQAERVRDEASFPISGDPQLEDVARAYATGIRESWGRASAAVSVITKAEQELAREHLALRACPKCQPSSTAYLFGIPPTCGKCGYFERSSESLSDIQGAIERGLSHLINKGDCDEADWCFGCRKTVFSEYVRREDRSHGCAGVLPRCRGPVRTLAVVGDKVRFKDTGGSVEASSGVTAEVVRRGYA